MAAVGISFGTESCVVAVSTQVGRHEVCASADGERSTPCYLSYSNGEILVGTQAKLTGVRYPANTAQNLVALTNPDIATGGQVKFTAEIELVKEGDEDKIMFPAIDPAEEKATKPEALELITKFFVAVKKDVVDGATNGDIASVAVAVPRYADKDAVAQCLRNAGYGNKLRVITSDTAAALSYGIGATPNTTHCFATAVRAPRSGVLVIDWGATALSVSLLDFRGGLFNLVSEKCDFGCGGHTFDKGLSAQLAMAYKRKTKQDPTDNARSMRKLLMAAESAKKTLAVAAMSSVDIEAFYEGMDMKEMYSRVKLEIVFRDQMFAQKLSGVLDQLLDSVKAAVESATSEDEKPPLISSVVVCGGMLRTPCAKTACAKAIDESREGFESLFIGKDAELTVHNSNLGDETVAVGACVQAAIVLQAPVNDEDKRTEAVFHADEMLPLPCIGDTVYAVMANAEGKLPTTVLEAAKQPQYVQDQVHKQEGAALLSIDDEKLLLPFAASGVALPVTIPIEVEKPTKDAEAKLTLLLVRKVQMEAEYKGKPLVTAVFSGDFTLDNNCHEIVVTISTDEITVEKGHGAGPHGSPTSKKGPSFASAGPLAQTKF